MSSSKPIRVGFDATATPLALVGAGYYVQQILKELSSRDEIKLTIFTRKNDGQRFLDMAPTAHILERAPTNTLGRVAYQSLKLGSLVDSLRLDVFHGPHYQLPLQMKTPSVVTIHDTTFFTHPEVHKRVKQQVFTRIIPKSIKQASQIITVSQHTADDIYHLFNVKDKVTVAPLGIDRERFYPLESDNQREDELKILSKRGITDNYIGFLGLLEPRKSIPTLISAFASIADEFPDLRLVLAGSKGWDFETIRDAISNSGVATRIILPGRLGNDEVGPFLRNARVFVYPSLYEGFGMPVAEAMACGTPTITSNSSSMKEVAGKGALLIEPGDISSLADHLKTLLTKDLIRNQMIKKALQRAQDFSWEQCANLHLQTYLEV